MKKMISILLILLVAGVMFADDPASVGFDITTTVAGIDEMKLTAVAAALENWDSVGAMSWTNQNPLVVTSANYSDTITAGYISTKSNNRTGYKVDVTASALKSEIDDAADAYINYKLTVGSVSGTTANGTAASLSEVIKLTSLSGLDVQSEVIKIDITQSDFEAAVSGTYTGTVTFNYTTT